MSRIDGDSSKYKYWGFISYSQRDKRWAAWLHRALETYKIPRQLIGTSTRQGTIPSRLFPVFRDREELAGASNLSEGLEQALRHSRCMLVICSPNSARSRWVNEEIKAFKAFGREDDILCLIVDGDPNPVEGGPAQCFPEALRYRVDANRKITSEPVEPIAADARPVGDGKRNALLKVLAGMLGIGYDTLKQRDQERRIRRLTLISALASTLVLVFAGLAYYAFFQKRLAEERGRLALARQLSAQAEAVRNAPIDALLPGESQLRSLRLAMESLSVQPTLEGDQALRKGLLGAPRHVARMDHPQRLSGTALSPDGRYVVTTSQDGRARIWETQTG